MLASYYGFVLEMTAAQYSMAKRVGKPVQQYLPVGVVHRARFRFVLILFASPVCVLEGRAHTGASSLRMNYISAQRSVGWWWWLVIAR
mmetsp:Transcript_17125/g.27370  ORF Transcript_17125/g.27370 Transcript_17125/m.27370 type:complete len:88 (-) Transcript_17125:389-652(-)